MKDRGLNKILIIILTLIFVALCVFAVYYHKNIYIPKLEKAQNYSTQIPVSESVPQKAGKRELLAENESLDIQLYKDGDYVIIVQNGKEAEFSDWNKNISLKAPEIYSFDFNGDNTDEIVIRVYEGADEKTGEDIYGIYALSPADSAESDSPYTVNYINSDSWSAVFKSTVMWSANQLISTPKRIQFVMDYSDSNITYNQDTGIVSDSGHVWYLLAPKTENGNYCTFKSCYIGPAVLSVNSETNAVEASFSVYFSYEEILADQMGGNITCGITLTNSKYSITEKTVKFSTNPEYLTPEPTQTAADWTKTFTNPGGMTSSRTISNLALRCGSGNSFRRISNETNQGAGVNEITVTKSVLTIRLKSGFSFAPEAGKIQNINIYIDYGSGEYNIANSAKITQENGIETLTVYFDAEYSSSDLKSFDIYAGV
ncbi:MAG: hypothetical protein LUG21_01460 [Clostridiales bacterium]|nr:hypothetical protein [Clostridiales bacterium]